MGSESGETTACITASRTMKLVAHVSSSMRNVRTPASSASAVEAACDVEPLASSVQNDAVSVPLGRLLMNSEMSVPRTLRPSSARSFMALASQMTCSRPSPAMWS